MGEQGIDTDAASRSSTMSPQEQADTELMQKAHLAAAHDLPELFEQHGIALGVRDVVVFLADLQQRSLIPFLKPSGPSLSTQVEALGIDSTLAGRAFQQTQTLTEQPDAADSSLRVWLPLLDGTERLGVMAVTVASAETMQADDNLMMVRLRRFASLAAELVMVKTLYGDTIVRLRRTSQMGLAAEMQWSLLPPLTFATPCITIAAGLEPAYEVAGDSIDYAVDDGVARFAVFDGMGHGLGSAQLATLTVAAYRNGRRGGFDMVTTAGSIDSAVAAAFEGAAFSTGLLAELDLRTGALTWVNAGHPAPLLVRGGRLVKHLAADPRLPFGLGESLGHASEIVVGSEALEPEDLVLLYTDGVVEARSPEGSFFGVEGLLDLLIRNLAAGLSLPETMRRLVRALLEHQQGQLADDASLLLVEWQPRSQEALIP